MNVLFLSIGKLDDLTSKSLYPDLLRKIKDEGHELYVLCSRERRLNLKTECKIEYGIHVLRLKVGNITKTNLIEKGISTILLENQFKSAIKRYFKNVKFDLIIYTTPPITYAKVIKYIKRRDNAKSYLLLKDIFPQNAVDLGMFSKKSFIYNFFRHTEKKLYQLSDYIGCMSQANVEYIINHNPYIKKEIVHVSPNSIEPAEITKDEESRDLIRQKYELPSDIKVFIYGGNLGKPQDIPFIIECLKQNQNKEDRFFLISGTGTEYSKLATYINEYKPMNIKIINGLPKQEYDKLLSACDVGLIFLDHRFTIPNFPSRLLAYMECNLPVIACTDTNTDIGHTIIEGEFGWWCESNNVSEFTKLIDMACVEDLTIKGENAKKYLEENYTVENSYKIVMNMIDD